MRIPRRPGHADRLRHDALGLALGQHPARDGQLLRGHDGVLVTVLSPAGQPGMGLARLALQGFDPLVPGAGRVYPLPMGRFRTVCGSLAVMTLLSWAGSSASASGGAGGSSLDTKSTFPLPLVASRGPLLNVKHPKPIAPPAKAVVRAGAATVSGTCRSAISAAKAKGQKSASCSTPGSRPSGKSIADLAGKPKTFSTQITPNTLAPGDSNTWPSWCANSPTNGYYLFDRYNECKESITNVAVYDTNTLSIIGTGAVQVIEWDSIARGSQSWLHKVSLNMFESSGVVTDGEWIYTAMSCSAGCVASASPPESWSQLLPGQALNGSWLIAAPVDAGQVGYFTQRVDTTFWNGAAPASMPYVELPQVPDSRCDSLPYFSFPSACVFPDAGPWFSTSESDPQVGDAATFYYTAQVTLPGNPGAYSGGLVGSPLTRMYNPAQTDANRAAACAGFVSYGGDDSCDEYPFAATYEGGAGSATGHVPSGQNSYAGSLYSSEINRDRLIDGDHFWLQITG